MKVIGTAGHIDHGKSTLVRALTGIDPDRLDEEKRRGMTIDLGFAWLTLPSGAEVSIVDVPGHERFVKNMLAGVGGIDVALLVVAGDEGVMPQTREHLDILDLLQVRQSVIALTKSDVADPELLDLVREEVSEVVQGTLLERSPVIPVSTVSGEGLPHLLRALDSAVASAPDPPDHGRPYVPIDRVFTIDGFGTVVTGTLHDGALRAGQEVVVSPTGLHARIRSMQTHKRQATEAIPGTRAAINLVGISKDQLTRGDVLSTSGVVNAVRRVDARVRVLNDSPISLTHGAEVVAHIGSAERLTQISILSGEEIPAGESGWVQLRFRSAVAVVPGLRFILRIPSPARTIAGGTVVDVAPRHRRGDLDAVIRLRNLTSENRDQVVLAALQGTKARSLDYLTMRTGLNDQETRIRLGDLIQRKQVIRLGSAYLTQDDWTRLSARIVAGIAEHHAARPLRKGMPKEELRSRLGVPADLWQPALMAMVESGMIRSEGSVVALTNHFGGSTDKPVETARILEILSRNPYAPPPLSEILSDTGASNELLHALIEEGKVVRVDESTGFERGAYDRMVETVMALIERDGSTTVGEVRDALSISRKFSLAVLEYLDSTRVTKRIGDTRVKGQRAPH